MRRTLLDHLVCPACAGHFELHEFSTASSDQVEEATLRCACRRDYPVFDGIPRLLCDSAEEFGQAWSGRKTQQNDELEASEFRRVWRQTQQSFGRQWLKYDVQNLKEDIHTFQTKTGFSTGPLDGLRILDAGCGGGRYTFVAAQSGAQVVAIDISRAVEKAAQLCRDLANVDVVQANLMELPFRNETFDRIFSIGVLHHTPDTRAAFETVVPFLRPGGLIAIWLYPKWRPFRERVNGFWRSITTRLPYPLVHAISVLGSPIGAIRGCIYRSRWPLAARIAWQTEKLLPGFSNHPDRRQRICDTFDWFTPQYQWHHTDDEVREWFESAGLTDIRNLSQSSTPYHQGQGAGVNFSGRKPAD